MSDDDKLSRKSWDDILGSRKTEWDSIKDEIERERRIRSDIPNDYGRSKGRSWLELEEECKGRGAALRRELTFTDALKDKLMRRIMTVSIAVLNQEPGWREKMQELEADPDYQEAMRRVLGEKPT